MGIKYECDRCNREAVAHIIIKRETPKGTPTSGSEYWLCPDHLKQFDTAIANGGARAALLHEGQG